MRVLIIGDIHGNLPAIEKVLTIERENFDRIVCHGDVVNYGPWSNECVQLLADMNNVDLLKGNHEEYFIEGCYPGHSIIAKTFFNYCYPFFNEHDIIQSYGHSLVCEDFTIQHTIEDKYIFPDTELLKIDRNYIIGHSHRQFKRHIGDHELVNTGSLGQNRKYINVIEYVIYDTSLKIVELKNIVYDYLIVTNEMKARKYPEICVNYYLNKAEYEA